MGAIGRVLAGGRDRGSAFALTPRTIVTASHVVRDQAAGALQFQLDGGSAFTVDHVESDRKLDVAVLNVNEDVDEPLSAATASTDARWVVASRPRDNDPLLSGSISDTHREIRNKSRFWVPVIQLHVDQHLGWHEGYSGSPVCSPNSLGTVVGVLVEQVLWRAPVHPGASPRATNVLYAIPIEEVIERFDLPVTLASKAREDGLRRAALPRPALRVSGLRVATALEQWRDREELVTRLRKLLLRGEPRVISVFGRRGIGKSALVAKVLVEYESDDQGRSNDEKLGPIVYLSTRRSTILSLAQVFGAAADLWPEKREHLASQWRRAGADALPDLWRALRHERPVLVLDNLDDLQDPVTHELIDEDLLELIDSACRTPYSPRIVVTSLHPLTAPLDLEAEVEPVEISTGLPDEDALALVRASSRSAPRVTEVTDAEVMKAVSRVDGRPRGLQVVGGLLRRPQAFRNVVASDAVPEVIVEKLVSTGYRSLPASGQRIIELLALAGSPLPMPAVLELLRGLVEGADATEAVEDVLAAGEIELDAHHDLLSLHPLDADYVRRRLLDEDPERQVALDTKLADWWKSQRKPIDDWLSLEDATPSEAEYRHRWRAGDHTTALAVLADAARIIVRYGESRSLTAAVTAARELKSSDPLITFHAHRCEAMAEFFGGSLNRAIRALRDARTLGEALDMSNHLPQIELDLGIALRNKGAGREAVAVLNRLADRGEHQAISRRLRQAATFELGLSLIYAGRNREAVEAAAQLDDLARPDDPPEPKALRANLRALTTLTEGRYDEAKDAADEAIRQYKRSPYRTDAGYMINLKGIALLAQGAVSEALEHLRDASELSASYGNPRLEGFSAVNLAWGLLLEHEIEAALAAAERAAERLTTNQVSLA